MKILFVCSGNKGSVNPLIQNQARSIENLGCIIDVFLINGKGIRGYLNNIKPLKEKIRNGNYDVVHAHYSLSAFVASLAGAKRLVVSLMGSDVKARNWYKIIIKLFANFFSWKSVIVKSKDMYQDLGIKDAIVIPNGVDLTRFKPMHKEECQKKLGWKTDHKHILFPSNPNRTEKNYLLATEIFALLNDKSIELHSLVNVPNPETPIWYNASDLVLMTSLWEGSPNAIKEAMACCRPIVATNVGDIEERLSGVSSGFVHNSFVAESFVGDISYILHSVENTNGREKIIADGLDAESVAKQIISQY